jgi:hypothetical protein
MWNVYIDPATGLLVGSCSANVELGGMEGMERRLVGDAERDALVAARDAARLTDKQRAERRTTEIKTRLAQIDAVSVRPLRAKLAGTATQRDADKLAVLESEAAALRLEQDALAAK